MNEQSVAVPDHRLRMNPVVAYHAMRHYLDRPADRRELAGEQGVQRLRDLVRA